MNKRVWLGTEQAPQGLVTALRLPELQDCWKNISGTEGDSWGVCAGPGLHVGPFRLRVFCDCDSSDSVQLQCVFTPRGLDVQGFGDVTHVSFDVFGMCFVYFSVSVSLLTTWITLRHKICIQDLEKNSRNNQKLKPPTNLKIQGSGQQIAFLSKSPAIGFTWLSKSLLLLLSLLTFC